MIVEKLGSTAMIIFWIYFLGMIGIGIYCRKYSTDFNGFMVGKRDLGPWYLGCAFFSTYLSSSVLIGNCGTAYYNGMSYMWNTVAQVLCTPIGIILLFAGLAKASKQLGVVTVPGYLKKRYLSNVPAGLLAAFMLVFLLPYLIGVAKGSALMISAVTGFTFAQSVILILGVTLVYSLIGGFMAGTITDFFQSLLMCFGATFVFVAALIEIGGINNVITTLSAMDYDHLVNSPGALGWNQLVGVTFVFGLAPWGLPQLLQKGFAMKDKRVIKPSVIIVIFLMLFILYTSNGNGAIARALYGDALLESTDSVFPYMVTQLMPDWAQGLVMVAVVAAAMSTLDGVILVMGAAASNDLYKGCINPNASDKTVLRITQAVMFIVLGLLAIITIGGVGTQITFLATFSHTMMASMIAVPMFGGMFWRGGNTTGCVTAQVCGACSALIWYALGQPFCHFFFPAMVMSFVGYVVGSKFGKPLPEEYIHILFPNGQREKEFHWGIHNSKMKKETVNK